MKNKQPVCIAEKCHEVKPRSEWGDGPWNNEPDRFDFKANGFHCFIHRNSNITGSWCGYVGVPRSHPAFGHHYDEVNVQVHGGLTFSDKCGSHICHVGGVVWWLGFDCSHAFDLSPRMDAYLKEVIPERESPLHGNHYWAMQEVVAETKSLAKQLASIGRVKYTQKGCKDRERYWRRLRKKIPKFLKDIRSAPMA